MIGSTRSSTKRRTLSRTARSSSESEPSMLKKSIMGRKVIVRAPAHSGPHWLWNSERDGAVARGSVGETVGGRLAQAAPYDAIERRAQLTLDAATTVCHGYVFAHRDVPAVGIVDIEIEDAVRVQRPRDGLI